MPQLDTLETGFLSFFLAFFIYALVLIFPEQDADLEDEIEISYLGLRAIQYFEMLRSCILFYNLNYYTSAKNAVMFLKSSKITANTGILSLYSGAVFGSPLEQFCDEDTFFLSFSILSSLTLFITEEDDYTDDDFATILDEILEDVTEDASTALLGC